MCSSCWLNVFPIAFVFPKYWAVQTERKLHFDEVVRMDVDRDLFTINNFWCASAL